MANDWDMSFGRIIRTIGLSAAIIVAVLACGTLILLLLHTGFDFWKDQLKAHFLGTIGLCAISCAAFGIVIFLRQSEGPIEFEAIGLKLRGAAGQVVLWAICTIVLSLCAKLLW